MMKKESPRAWAPEEELDKHLEMYSLQRRRSRHTSATPSASSSAAAAAAPDGLRRNLSPNNTNRSQWQSREAGWRAPIKLDLPKQNDSHSDASKQQQDYYPVVKSAAEIEAIVNRLVPSKEKMKLRAEKADARRHQLDEKDCTFAPTITPRARSAKSSAVSTKPARRSSHMSSVAVSQCTFQPKTNHTIVCSSSSSSGNVFNRLTKQKAKPNISTLSPAATVKLFSPSLATTPPPRQAPSTTPTTTASRSPNAVTTCCTFSPRITTMAKQVMHSVGFGERLSRGHRESYRPSASPKRDRDCTFAPNINLEHQTTTSRTDVFERLSKSPKPHVPPRPHSTPSVEVADGSNTTSPTRQGVSKINTDNNNMVEVVSIGSYDSVDDVLF